MSDFCPAPAGKSLIPNAPAPPGVLIVPDFLSASLCLAWCQYFRSEQQVSLDVQNVAAFEKNSEIAFENHSGRITQAVDYKEKKQEILKEVTRGFSECVMPYFNTQLAAFEKPTVLRYEAGGRYDPHSDNEFWDAKAQAWRKTLNRDYSILIYLNEEYEGGKLALPNFLCKVTPRTGMLVAFPSDHRYLHAAEPLISGERFAVVSWASRTKLA